MNLVPYLCTLLWVSLPAVAATANTKIIWSQKSPSPSPSTSTWSILSVPKLRTGIDLDETREVEILIEDIARQLKQFIEPESFLFHEFDSQMMVLKEELYVASSNAKVTIPCTHLEDKLKYTQHMFYVMCTSSEHMNRYNFFWQTDKHLVHCMSKLNAQLLGLYEVDDSPDLNSGEFEQDVILYISSVDLWKHKFESLCDVSFEIRAIFKIQTFCAQASLRVLRSFVKFLSWISRYPLWGNRQMRGETVGCEMEGNKNDNREIFVGHVPKKAPLASPRNLMRHESEKIETFVQIDHSLNSEQICGNAYNAHGTAHWCGPNSLLLFRSAAQQ